MCRHFTHISLSLCGHTYPIPQAFPYYIPPQYCSAVTDALNFYHTQPDRMPEQFPIPFPRPCPIEAAESVTVVVLGLCEPCAAERKKWGEGVRLVEAPADDGRNGDVPNVEQELEARNSDAGENGAQTPRPGESKPVSGSAPADEKVEVEDDAIIAKGPLLAKGPIIVTTDEVVGAWWPERTSLRCEGWTTDKNGRRQTRSWIIRARLMT
ncbi:hypothetical protein MMC30_006080 [Trapelia coarctata]|nr:hypothetical protein [Trapelia coarctata]